MTSAALNCSELELAIMAYVDGEMSAVPSLNEAALVSHLTACTACLDKVVAMRNLKHMVVTKADFEVLPERLLAVWRGRTWATLTMDGIAWQTEAVWAKQDSVED